MNSTQKIIQLVAAISSNYAIGKDNKIPWHIPEDLKRFKQLTIGDPMIMGRKTFESFGAKALPGRDHIILSKNTELKSEPEKRVFYVNSLKDALEKAESLSKEKISIIGGESIFKHFLPFADILYITHVDLNIEGAHAFFPRFDKNDFEQKIHPAILSPNKYQYIDYHKKSILLA